MRVNTNIPALQAYNALTSVNSQLQKSINRLSTGLRINSAADDAAGLAISEKMRAQIKGLDQATANAQDGISMIQTAEGALSETHSILQRMRELSVQAANDTLTQEDRSYIQLEVDELKEEVTRIANTTQFNKKKLLDGSAAAVWSSDNLATEAIINGGLRKIDQFGQKAAVEGNFKISINADPGKAQIQKSDIFKIKHENVIMNVKKDANNGIQDIAVDALPAGEYRVMQDRYDSATVQKTVVTVKNYFDTKDAVANGGITTDDFDDILASVKLVVSGTGTFSSSNGSSKVDVAVIADAAEGVFYKGTHYTQGAQITTIENVAVGSATLADADALTFANLSGAAAGDGMSVLNAGLADMTKAVESAREMNVVTGGSFAFGGFYGLTEADSNMTVVQSALGNVQNASVLLTVKGVNTATGEVTFRAQVNAMDENGELSTYVDDNLIIGANGVKDGYEGLGMFFIDASAISISNVAAYDKGDKLVLNFQSTADNAKTDITINTKLNEDWPNNWENANGNPAEMETVYRIDAEAVQGTEVQFKQFYLNEQNGTVHEGNVKITFNENFETMSSRVSANGGYERASFEAAYVGQVAEGDVKLRDLDKFWDANGTFLLNDPKTLTLNQGDGKKTSITLYATDTLEDVRGKLNDAIASGLGQSQYVGNAGAEFVSFVDSENKIKDNPMSVEGTFIIRSLVPGAKGEISFSGDEDLIKAFSLNTIQKASESTFTVSVADAHDSRLIASNEKITGNTLYGIVNENVDVIFDNMANIDVMWNDKTMSFDLTKANGTYETVLHLCDNTTVLQIGANEGEDMGLNIGDMSAKSLGLEGVLVTDRESAARSITVVDSAISKVSKQRAKLGAYQNRLEHTINNLTTASTNTSSAESRIRDADMAKEMMTFTKLNILSQAGNSMLSQANSLPQSILSLLR